MEVLSTEPGLYRLWYSVYLGRSGQKNLTGTVCINIWGSAGYSPYMRVMGSLTLSLSALQRMASNPGWNKGT